MGNSGWQRGGFESSPDSMNLGSASRLARSRTVGPCAAARAGFPNAPPARSSRYMSYDAPGIGGDSKTAQTANAINRCGAAKLPWGSPGPIDGPFPSMMKPSRLAADAIENHDRIHEGSMPIHTGMLLKYSTVRLRKASIASPSPSLDQGLH
jgi:hypothetical protein